MIIPPALAPYATQSLWLVWNFENDKNGKPTKVPYQAAAPTRKAMTTNPETWSDAATAQSVAEKKYKFSGIGICLRDTNLVALDVDHCRDPNTGVIDPWVLNLIKRFGTYTEVTPSKTGLRIIGYGTGEKIHCKQKVPMAPGVSVETYRACERYIAVTGWALDFAPQKLTDISELADTLVAELTAATGNGKDTTPDSAGGEQSQDLPASLTTRLYIPDAGAGVPHAGYPTRSELLFAFVTDALRARVSPEKIIAACLDDHHRGHAVYSHCVDNGGRDYVARQIAKARENFYANGKRVIKVERGKEYLAWRETQRALIAAKCQVFVRGGRLVEPLWREERGAETDRPVLAMSLVAYNRERLTDQVARNAAQFVKYDAHLKGLVDIDPPRGVIEILLERQDWDFPTIVGVINTPTMRPDGSLLTIQGYDPATQLWHKSDVALPPIPNAPTKEQAEEALKLLDDLLSEFPFVVKDGVDRSVALAGIMTAVLRGAFPVAPLFFVAKPEAGTGASYFVRLVAAIATGQDATPLIASEDPKELQKELSAKAFEGRPILNLNNLTFDLESALLCQILTEGVVDIRPFGRNDQTVTCDCRSTTVFANGNNVRLVGDLVRRAVTCRMDAKKERPELRTFEKNPIEMVKKNRGAYLAAVFTVARAYIAAGNPDDIKVTALAGFEEWSQKVRKPLIWLGRKDPALSMEDARSIDPERGALGELIDALIKCFGTQKTFTANDVFNQAVGTYGSDGKLVHAELIAVFSRDGRNVNAKAIGKQLMKYRSRVSEGRFIELAKSSSSSGNTYTINSGAVAPPEPAAPAQEEEPM